jgi:hypothetical protein
MKKSNTSKKQGTDYERLDAMTDDDIDFSEIPPITDEMFARGVARPPRSVTEPREQLTVTLDRDLAKCYMQEESRKPARPKARRA